MGKLLNCSLPANSAQSCYLANMGIMVLYNDALKDQDPWIHCEVLMIQDSKGSNR